uniref:Uncharacterized protein n=1 Tax=Molossus molossus TaxID=27622 RepID=A0A7J8BYM9_MOLMO|nr:hypothetical protein HJG59_010100 [Molossus molossus]
MATRVRTAAIWVPPLLERDSSDKRIRKLQSQEPTVGQGTPDQRPLPREPQQRLKSHKTEQILEWLFISQEQLKTAEFETTSGKLIITWNGIRKIEASLEVWQITMIVLDLETCVFLLQIMCLQDRSFINLAHMGRV